jgi:hypothetical protein
MCHPGHSATPSADIVRPRWNLLYGVTLPQIVALAAIEATAPPIPARALLRWVLALGIFVSMGLWARANRAAFDLQEWCACAGETMTVRVIHSGRGASEPPAEDHEAPAPVVREYELVG